MPPPYPFRRFVLLCPQRSGSNALTSLLNGHGGVRLYGQLFNNGREYRRINRADLGLPLFRPHPETTRHLGPTPPLRRRLEWAALRLAPRERDLSRYLEQFWRRFGAEGAAHGGVPPVAGPQAVGFKLHDFQLADDDLQALFDDHLDRIVILHRKNLLRSAVSWAVAMRTDEWVQKRGEDRAQRRPLRLDLDELAWFVDKTARSVETWQRLAAASPTPALTLTYEEHVVPRTVGPLFDFLGLTQAEAPAFGTRKLAARRYDHVANAAEIDRALGSPETGYLFEDRHVGA